MKLVGAMLARNEAGRYLDEVLDNLQSFCHKVLVVDDNSTDNTVEVATKAKCHVLKLPDPEPMWGKEAAARAFLWDAAANLCDKHDWVYFADADHFTVGGHILREGMRSWIVNAWALRLFDVWDEKRTVFRADGHWQGWKFPRPWMVKPHAVPDGWMPQWPRRGVHTGHIPANFPVQMGVMPMDVYVEHLGYSTPEDREARYQRYRAVKAQLQPHEWAHAASIVDAS